MGFEALEAALGHNFQDQSHLKTALTHASFAGGQRDVTSTYQRYEFLGDRILALVIADTLMERFPSAEEGEMARRLNHLVRAETCANIARKVGIDAHVLTDDLDVRCETRAARAVLADVCEALIAALYLDGGLDVARRFILTQWLDLLDDKSAARRDPKTALQEWAHARHKATPVYTDIGRDGPDHAPIFEIRVDVEGAASVVARGTSKRDAQQSAAEAMLVREGVWKEPQGAKAGSKQ
ncbi:MAG: ribonuclease III [Pseudomonadota bacterium]